MFCPVFDTFDTRSAGMYQVARQMSHASRTGAPRNPQEIHRPNRPGTTGLPISSTTVTSSPATRIGGDTVRFRRGRCVDGRDRGYHANAVTIGTSGKSDRENGGRGEGAPPEVIDQAKGAFSARVQGDLASLVFDSLIDGKGSPDDHVMRFEHSLATIEVHVSYAPQNTGIEGSVTGFRARRAALHLGDGDLAMITDVESGRYGFQPVGHGLVKLSFEAEAGGPTMWTDWFRI